MRQICLFLVAALLSAGVTTIAFSQVDYEAPTPDPDSLSYRVLEGTIGNDLEIRMVLRVEEESASGYYVYKSRGIPLNLSGEREWRTLSLSEYPFDSPDGDAPSSGRFEGEIRYEGGEENSGENMIFEGVWTPQGTSKGPPLPFKLHEHYPEGTAAAELYSFGVSWSRTRNGIPIRRSREVSLPQLRGDSPGIERVNAYIREYAAGFPQFGDDYPDDGLIGATSFDPAKAPDLARIEELIAVTPPPRDEWWFAHSNAEEFIDWIKVVYNDRNLVSLELGGWGYSGGAHGNSANSHLTFDLTTGHVVRLSDILKPGFEEPLARAGEAALRKKWDLKPDEPLSEGGTFEDRIELNDNWHFTADHSIGFSYSPYEIGPYAAGFITFSLPREAVSPWVQPGSVFERAAVR